MRFLRIILITLLIILLVSVIGSAIAYTIINSRHTARPEALAALTSDVAVTVTNPEGEDWHVFEPTGMTPTTGFIIYPGGFVDPVAYAPIARAIAEVGHLVVINPMPLNLAVLDIEAADRIIAAFPEIATWAIGGHSLGGAMATEYVAGNPDEINGLALWAAYPASNTDLSDFDLTAVSVYGDADGVASVADVKDGAARLPAGAVFILIPGGNHTQFGRYGEGLQHGDNPAGIGRDEQQQLMALSLIHISEPTRPY